MHNSATKRKPGDVAEYLQSLKQSPKYGPQVVCHKTFLPELGESVSFSSATPLKLQNLLQSSGISALYRHQWQAHKYIRAGKNVLVATPTASGKSMVYNIPVMEAIIEDPSATALYLFPLKALAQDQLQILEVFEPVLKDKNCSQSRPLAALYDGDTPPGMRQSIRKNPPNVVITNPDMLHLSFLPYHSGWAVFLRQLRFIVIDEVHSYRGVFGSHMAWVLKRLQRILKYYGAEPVFIMLSATIGNPQQFGEALIGEKTKCILKSYAPRPKRNMVFINPLEGGVTLVCQLLEAALKRGLRSIVYTGSRKMAELITLWTKQNLGSLAPRISSYRSGFLASERRQIEQDLSNGTLLGVISTSALELGIDIGDLDICILAGYPGSIMTTWQRGGRVGRGMTESAVILVAQENALDQYYMKNHEDFFNRPMEYAIVNPDNAEIAAQHLHCAAAERALHKDERALFSVVTKRIIDQLTDEGILIRGYGAKEWFSKQKYPQRQVNIRGAGLRYGIVSKDNGEIFGEIDSARALHECHEGAIYLHSSKTWHVEKCDTDNGEILVSPFTGRYHTRPTSEKQIEVLEVFDEKTFDNYGVLLGKLLIRERVTGYQKIHNRTGKIEANVTLDLPEQCLETVGLWLSIPVRIESQMKQENMDFTGAIHALEHAMIGILPLFVLCDRNDIGGLSSPIHHQTPGPVIFLYDGYPGGMGLCRDAYLRMGDLLRQTAKTVSSCTCENGCPSCVHSPKCGSGNRPIDKGACGRLLTLLKS